MLKKDKKRESDTIKKDYKSSYIINIDRGKKVMVHSEIKTKIIFFLTVLYTPSMFGQVNTISDSIKTNDLRNEIGINIASITNETHYLLSNFNYGLNNNILNGIMYKRHFNKNALRIGFDFYHYDYSYDFSTGYNFPVNNKYTGHYKVGKFRLGYERLFRLNREQPFAAIDLSVSCGKGNQVFERYDNLTYLSYHEEKNVNLTEIGIEPVIGVKYRLIRRLSLTIEISARLYYVCTSGNIGHHSSLIFAFNPIRLFSFNLHL